MAGPTVLLNSKCYCKVMMHAAKFMADAVNGVIVGKIEGGTVTALDAVPFCHSHHNMVPQLEIALSLVDEYCKANSLQIVGAYFGSEDVRENGPELSPSATRLADKIQSISSHACLMLIDNLKFTRHECPAVDIYKKSSGKGWAQVEEIALDETAEQRMEKCMEEQLHASLHDFEEHLDCLSYDFFNKELM